MIRHKRLLRVYFYNLLRIMCSITSDHSIHCLSASKVFIYMLNLALRDSIHLTDESLIYTILYVQISFTFSLFNGNDLAFSTAVASFDRQNRRLHEENLWLLKSFGNSISLMLFYLGLLRIYRLISCMVPGYWLKLVFIEWRITT